MWNNKKRQKTECGHIEGTPDGEGYQWSITDTPFDLLWACDSHEKDRYPNILMHGYTHGRRPSGRPRKRWLGNITEDCEELNDFMNLTIHQAITANDGVKWINILSATRATGARGHRLRRRGFKSSKSRNLDHSNWYHSKAWVLFPIRLP